MTDTTCPPIDTTNNPLIEALERICQLHAGVTIPCEDIDPKIISAYNEGINFGFSQAQKMAFGALNQYRQHPPRTDNAYHPSANEIRRQAESDADYINKNNLIAADNAVVGNTNTMGEEVSSKLIKPEDKIASLQRGSYAEDSPASNAVVDEARLLCQLADAIEKGGLCYNGNWQTTPGIAAKHAIEFLRPYLQLKNNMTVVDERAEFEKWTPSHFTENHWSLERHSKTGDYLRAHVQEVWIGWQARAALRTQPAKAEAKVSLEECAKAMCWKEHEGKTGMDSPEESWASWHTMYEIHAKAVLDSANQQLAPQGVNIDYEM